MGVLKAVLALETGRVFEGRAFGAPGETAGEVLTHRTVTARLKNHWCQAN
jgi:carbamoylphosphate synthase small subunit